MSPPIRGLQVSLKAAKSLREIQLFSGLTYASSFLHQPSNARDILTAAPPNATFPGEFMGETPRLCRHRRDIEFFEGNLRNFAGRFAERTRVNASQT